MKKLERIFALLLAAVLCVGPAAPAAAARAAENEIEIRSAQDLAQLAEQCALDTWSEGKIVRLRCDLDLSGMEFEPIPIFSGTFEGQGHTISGLRIGAEDSITGLFCIVAETGLIRNLIVAGSVCPSGAQTQVGGIAGINCGKLLNCTFYGAVSGDGTVGGIAGQNEASGSIRSCTVSGSIRGEHYTGGIAGKNAGSISSCTNRASVNTLAADGQSGLSELESDLVTAITDTDTTELVDSATDTGGIAGYSSGLLLSDSNYGSVGYPHVGYNVGGVVGCSSGYLSGCINHGRVNGRKEVGGIAGQMEPDIILVADEDGLSRLEEELNGLNAMVDRALRDMDESSDTISGRFEQISGYTDSALAQTKGLAEGAADWSDENLTEINRFSQLLADTLERTVPLLEQLEDVSGQVDGGIEFLQRTLEQLVPVIALGGDGLGDLQLAADDLDAASQSAKAALEQIETALALAGNALTVEDESALRQGLAQAAQGIDELGTALEAMGRALGQIGDGLAPTEDWKELLERLDALQPAWDELAAALQAAVDGLHSVARGVRAVLDNVNLDTRSLSDALDHVVSAVLQMSRAADRTEAAAGHLRDTLADGCLAAGRLEEAVQTLADAAGAFADAAASATRLVGDGYRLFRDLSQERVIQFAPLSDGMRASGNALYAAMEGLSEEMDGLSGAVHAAAGTLTEDLQAVNGQFLVVMERFLDLLRGSGAISSADRFADTSEEDWSAAASGKAAGCVNYGAVAGDRNVGGIVGAMAVEYDFDPEDDLTADGGSILNARYEAKAVVQHCVNRGAVEVKKDCAGGIVGLMSLGVVVDSEGYGSISSGSGSYLGGIAGQSASAIRRCWAKCLLSGGRYTGGIVGAGSVVTDCRALVRIEDAVQFAGAISGSVDGTFSGNLFVSDTLAGLDRFSYSGRAEPVDYDTLLSLEGAPAEFGTFSLRFWADGAPVGTVAFDYGGSLSAEEVPDVPPKEGYSAAWSRTEFDQLTFDETVEAVYTPCVTALAGGRQRESGGSVFLVEGSFTGEDVLSAVRSGTGEDAGETWALTIPADGAAVHTVRYLPRPGERVSAVRVLEDGVWQDTAYSYFGAYLQFQAAGSAVTVSVSYGGAGGKIAIAAAAVLAAVSVGMLLCLHRKKRRRQTVEK